MRKLLNSDFLQLDKTGKSVFFDELCFALDEGKCIFGEFLVETVFCFIEPLKRNLFLCVGNNAEVEELDVADVFTVNITSFEADHLVGDTLSSEINGSFACCERFVNIGLGCTVSGTALEKAELNTSDLCAGLLLDFVCEIGSKTAELRMTEAVFGVGKVIAVFGNILAVLVVDAFGNAYDALSVSVIYFLDLFHE